MSKLVARFVSRQGFAAAVCCLPLVTVLVAAASPAQPCVSGWVDDGGAPAQVTAGSAGSGTTSVDVQGARTLTLSQPLEPGEHLYGSGERFGSFDLVGHAVDTVTAGAPSDASDATSYTVTPFLLSSRGTGMLLETTAPARIDATVTGCLRIRVDTPTLRAHTFHGPTPDAVLHQHAGVVGLPPLPPPWAFGVWKTAIGGSAAVRAELDRLDAADIPVDAVWIYDAMDETSGWGWPWDIYAPAEPGTYPDLPGLIDEVHDRGLKAVGYLNPLAYPGSNTWRVAQDAGWLVNDRDGAPILAMGSAYLDLTDPAARAWFGHRVEHAVGVVGFDGAMQDYGDEAPVDGVYANGAPGALARNSYPVLYSETVREAAQRAKPDGTAFITRSGYTGAQRYTTGAWTGDQLRSWDRDTGLASVVPAMLSAGISGWPYWGPDIGGFFRPEPPPAEKELWIRWVQLGALSPLMRDMLGAAAGEPADVWTDAETVGIYREYARLHRTLTPYLHRMAEHAHRTGIPLVRPLFLADPTDPMAYRIDDQYLLGDSLMVAPVTREGQREREVYLPAGQWCDVWTGQHYDGRSRVTVSAPLEQIPLLARADAPNAPLPCPPALG